MRSPSHSRRAEAARRAARHVLWLIAGIGAAIIVLMYVLDAAEIRLMPKRGTPSLWSVRILTDFGKSEYVLWTLFGLMAAVLIASAADARHGALAAAGARHAPAIPVPRRAGAGAHRAN